MFSTWLSEYPEDFKSLGEPSRLLRLAPLLPQDSSSAADLRARLLRIAEELSEKALLPDAQKGLYFNWDPARAAAVSQSMKCFENNKLTVRKSCPHHRIDLFAKCKCRIKNDPKVFFALASQRITVD